jgi:hypothetical protein
MPADETAPASRPCSRRLHIDARTVGRTRTGAAQPSRFAEATQVVLQGMARDALGWTCGAPRLCR